MRDFAETEAALAQPSSSAEDRFLALIADTQGQS